MDLHQAGIYKLVCTSNGHFYIGQAKNLSKRFRQHIYELRRGSHGNRHLLNVFNKYGEDNLELQILCTTTNPGLLDSLEQGFLDVYFGTGGCMNLCSKSNSPAGREPWNKGKKGIYSAETRDRISASLTGRTLSDERREAMRILALGNKYSLGHKHSEATRQKMSDSKRGVPWTEARKNRESGRKHSAETRQKMRAASQTRQRNDKGAFI